MVTLLLDSSNTALAVGIEKDGQLIGYTSYEAWQQQSEHMIPEIDKLMENLHVNRQDIGGIICSIGPGSYTGVRIAVVIAKMIGAMNNIKVYEFSTLSLIASSVDTESYPLIDARRGNAYLSHFDKDLNRLMDDEVVNVNEFFNGKNKELIVESGLPNPIKLINSKEVKLVEDIDKLSPNYIQLVEAERIRRGLQ